MFGAPGVGKGTQAAIFKGCYEDDCSVAIRLILLRSKSKGGCEVNEAKLKQFNNEVLIRRILTKCCKNNPISLPLLDAFICQKQNNDALGITVSPFVSGNLLDLVVRTEASARESILAQIKAEVKRIMTDFHKCKCIHRDVLFANFLYEKNGNSELKIYISDFENSAFEIGERFMDSYSNDDNRSAEGMITELSQIATLLNALDEGRQKEAKMLYDKFGGDVKQLLVDIPQVKEMLRR